MLLTHYYTFAQLLRLFFSAQPGVSLSSLVHIFVRRLPPISLPKISFAVLCPSIAIVWSPLSRASCVEKHLRCQRAFLGILWTASYCRQLSKINYVNEKILLPLWSVCKCSLFISKNIKVWIKNNYCFGPFICNNYKKMFKFLL